VDDGFPHPALRAKLDALPDRPGVYLYRDSRGDLLYVGKAKSLRSRVRSYFQPSAQHPPRVERGRITVSNQNRNVLWLATIEMSGVSRKQRSGPELGLPLPGSA